MLLHVLGHVDAHHRLFGIEQEFRERLAELGLADARGARGTGKNHSGAADRRGPRANGGWRSRRSSPLRPGRPRACSTPLPCAGVFPSRPRASSRPECRSTWKPLPRFPLRSPCCGQAAFPWSRRSWPARACARARATLRTGSARRASGHPCGARRPCRASPAPALRAPWPRPAARPSRSSRSLRGRSIPSRGPAACPAR